MPSEQEPKLDPSDSPKSGEAEEDAALRTFAVALAYLFSFDKETQLERACEALHIVGRDDAARTLRAVYAEAISRWAEEKTVIPGRESEDRACVCRKEAERQLEDKKRRKERRKDKRKDKRKSARRGGT